ncbi:MAG: response regulator, partial [Limisphaerales bacterium]
RTKSILVVDDEPDIADLVRLTCETAGYQVSVTHDGGEALRRATATPPDLVILDLVLPTQNGFELCKKIREHSHTKKLPIIILTGRTAELDRILAFELGASDYITKPFNPRELVLRVRNLLPKEENTVPPADIVIGELAINLELSLVKVKDKRITLTPTEFRLLTFLVDHRDSVHTRDQLLALVWKNHSKADVRIVDTHIRRLREKLSELSNYIITVRTVGYRFSDPND